MRSPAYWWSLGGGLLLLGVLARLAVFPITTTDYVYFYGPWFDMLATQPGLTAFRQNFADYAPLYLYILKALTFVPLPSLYSIKLLSVAADLLIALGCCLIARVISPGMHSYHRLVLFAAVFLAPTILVNSALWGQSDALYAAPLVFCLYWLITGRPLLAALAFSLAFAIKLQAIFFLPILVGYCAQKGSLRYLALVPLVFVLSVVPAALSGGSWSYWLGIYAYQAGEYPWLSVSAQSIFAFVQPMPLAAATQTLLFWAGIVVSAVVALGFAVAAYRARSPQELLVLALLCVATLPYLLPRMHERYFYLADVFSILYAAYRPRHWWVPAIVVSASFFSYMPFLSPQVALFSALHVDLRVPAAVMLAVLVFLYVAYARTLLRGRVLNVIE